jgi:hypothetical protein
LDKAEEIHNSSHKAKENEHPPRTRLAASRAHGTRLKYFNFDHTRLQELKIIPHPRLWHDVFTTMTLDSLPLASHTDSIHESSC